MRHLLPLLLLPLAALAADPLPDGAELELVKRSSFCLLHTHAFSHDGKRVATNWDGTIKVWDPATRKLLYTHKAHDSIGKLAWTPDGKLIGLTEWTGELFTYSWSNEKDSGPSKETLDDFRAGDENNRLSVRYYATALSADGRWMAAFASEDKLPSAVVLYSVTANTSTRYCFRKLSLLMQDCRFLSFSDDGNTLFAIGWCANDGDRVSAYDLTAKDPTEPAWVLTFPREGERTEQRDGKTVTIPARGKPYEVRSVDGKRIVLEFGDPGHVIEVWDGPREKRLLDVSAFPYYRSATLHDLAFDLSPDGKRLAFSAREKSGLMGGVVCDLGTGKELVRLTAGPGDGGGLGSDLRFSRDGKRLYRDYMEWDAETGKNLTPVGHHSGIQALLVSGDGKTIVTAGCDHSARGWDAKTGQEKWLTCFPLHVGGLRQLNGDKAAASSLSFGPPLPQPLLDLNTGKLSTLPGDMAKERKVKRGGGTRAVAILPVALSPDGTTAVCVDFATPALEVWDWPAGKRRAVLKFDPPAKTRLGGITCVSLTPDGKELIGVFNYTAIKPEVIPGVCGLGRAFDYSCLERWDIARGVRVERTTYEQYTLTTLASNDKRSVVIRPGKVSDLETGAKLLMTKENEGWMFTSHRFFTALSQDGNTLVIQAYNGKESETRWYDLESKKLLAARPVDTSEFAFLPDGRLVSVGDEVRIWKTLK